MLPPPVPPTPRDDQTTASRLFWPLVVAGWALHAGVAVLLAEAARRDGSTVLRWNLPAVAAVSAYWVAMTPVVRRLTARLAPTRVGGVARSALGHAAAALALTLGAVVVRWAVLRAILGDIDAIRLVPMVGRLADYYVASYAALVALCTALDSHRAYVERARHALVLEAQLARARLDFLQRQLRPHFLFNALNAVAELADEAPALAARMLRQLARLLRSATEHLEATEVALRDDLPVLDAYVEVQRARFGAALEVTYRLDARVLDALVPTFVLQPLVENAIRHGVERRRGGGRVTIAAWPEGNRLRLSVEDDGAPGRGPAATSRGAATTGGATARSGIGLWNTRQRLAHLYGDAQRLELRQLPGGGTAVDVELPLRLAPAAAAPAAPARHDDAAAPAAPPDDAEVTVRLHAPAGTPAAAPAAVMPSGADAEPDAPARGALRSAAAVAALWAACGALWSLQTLTIAVTRTTPMPASAYAAPWVTAGAWALLTPLVLLLARRVRFGGRPAAAVLVHLVACAAVAAAPVALTNAVLGAGPWPVLAPGTVTPLSLNALVYLAIVAWANARDFARRRRERAIAAERLAADVERLRLEAVALEVSPAFVGAVLDRTADVVTRAPARAEEVIEGLADLLRELLDAPPGGGQTVRREVAIVGDCAALLALAFGRGVTVRRAVPAWLADARVPAGGLRSVLAAAARRLAERPGDELEIRVVATPLPAAGPGDPVGELTARVVSRPTVARANGQRVASGP